LEPEALAELEVILATQVFQAQMALLVRQGRQWAALWPTMGRQMYLRTQS